ncbi:DNA cytosine methyltransferase [Micromonospora sp. IBHARD004]|uniref:DNA cytosine methyltransferase n=1 Tax=Micromonospora sp. IBHARD004 TaxID=3457764 RepID=UPI004058477F
MENARELVMGRFQEHLAGLTGDLASLGYEIHFSTHFPNRFGLPQKRERALVLAVRNKLPLLTMDDLWRGFEVDSKATHVCRAIWDRPAPTIKRECSHVGNGRYAHPEQDRLCPVRELAILNGFPAFYQFRESVSNMYRHIGDAVPPLFSYQMAALVSWILTGSRPEKHELVMPGTHLRPDDIRG